MLLAAPPRPIRSTVIRPSFLHKGGDDARPPESTNPCPGDRFQLGLHHLEGATRDVDISGNSPSQTLPTSVRDRYAPGPIMRRPHAGVIAFGACRTELRLAMTRP